MTSDNRVFTLRGLRPLVVRCIIMEEAQTTHDPAKDRSYLRPGRFVNTRTLCEIRVKTCVNENICLGCILFINKILGGGNRGTN